MHFSASHVFCVPFLSHVGFTACHRETEQFHRSPQCMKCKHLRLRIVIGILSLERTLTLAHSSSTQLLSNMKLGASSSLSSTAA